jgi:predicted nucleotide-binding protein
VAGMERFTQRARRALSLAHQEAERTHHNSIGPEHLLISLMLEEGGVGARVLRELGLTTDRVREVIKRVTTASDNFDPSRVEIASETQRVLEFAVDEARRLGHNYIGTEHILLGLVLVDSPGLEVLRRLGVTAEQIRRQTWRVLNESASTSSAISSDKVPNTRKINQVFILYGQDEQKKTVAAWIQILGLVPVLLDEKNEGKGLLEHLDQYSDDAAFVIIILTNHDLGNLPSDPSNMSLRIDHNFFYELGYFRGKLGRNRVCVLYLNGFPEEVKVLSDLAGITYISLNMAGTWMTQLAKAIQDAGLKPNLINTL